MRINDEYLMERIHGDKITSKEVTEIFRYIISRKIWRDIIKYDTKKYE